MSNSLINTAMSGLNAAQAALSTVSNNISNATTAGYNRQNAIISQASGSSSMQGYIGNGVTVMGINREYNQFVVNQLRNAETKSSSLTSYYNQVSQIDDLLSDTTNNLSSTLQGFFSSIQSMTSAADDTAARQTVIGKAQGLVNQFQSSDKYLSDLDSGVNQQITDTVSQINNYSQQIAKLNDQITRTRGSSGGVEPNALLDQRDELVSNLNKLVGVTITQQDGDAYNVAFADGTVLVQGTNSYSLQALQSSSDPNRITVGYTNNGASQPIEIAENRITSGTLGGILNFRTQSLDPARNQLGQIALTMADSFNKVQEAGYDLNGDKGEAFFSFSDPSTIPNAKNTGMASLSVAYTDTAKVQASDYKISFDGSNWQVTRISDNANIKTTAGMDADGKPTLSFDGLNVTVSDATAAKKGDSFTVKTVTNAATNLKVEISDSAKIAAASEEDGGVSDNRNAQKMLDLQTAKVVQGKSTLTAAYASLVSSVGNQASTAKVNSTTQTNIVTQLSNQQQSISGVNLNEEYGDLQRYQQYYLANAQVIQTASTLFNALMDLRA